MVRRESNAESLLRRFREGRLVGTFVKLPATEIIEIVAAAGFDFALVDLEHSQLGEAEALRLLRHAFAMGFPSVVRVPSCEPGQVNRMLEAGAQGIQLSSVRSIAQVRELVAATRYAPEGRRSVSLAHPVAGYGAVPLRDAVSAPHPLLVGQIETAETEDPLEAILGAGIDVAFLGITDLTVDLGFDQARVDARVTEIEEATGATGVVFGAFASDAASVPPAARYVALSSDISLMRSAAGKAVAGVR